LRVIWTHEALESLRDIHAFLDDRSARAADRVVLELIRQGDVLGEWPLLGRMVPEFGAVRLRERIVSGYRLIYAVGPEAVGILVVLHGSRDLPRE
jgi:plasmid stabilization system protein ParE